MRRTYTFKNVIDERVTITDKSDGSKSDGIIINEYIQVTLERPSPDTIVWFKKNLWVLEGEKEWERERTRPSLPSAWVIRHCPSLCQCDGYSS